MSNVLLDAYYSLGGKLNKVKGANSDETSQGIIGVKESELKLDMDNAALGDLTVTWDKKWTESKVYQEWNTKTEDNENYWLGKQYEKPAVDKSRSDVDNAIFEALETYLPQATRRNPQAMVEFANKDFEQNQDAQVFIKDLQSDLAFFADEIKFRLKMKKGARHWAIYLLGAAKLTWDVEKNIPSVKIVRPKKLILDPDETVDEDGYTGEYVGEHRKLKADVILDYLKNNGGEADGVKKIEEMAGDKLGTEIGFIEWWTDKYMCWTIEKTVLLKKKNMHWNYDQQMPIAPEEEGLPMEGMMPEGAEGMPALPNLQTTNVQGPMGAEADVPLEDADDAAPEQEYETVPGINHLGAPKKPWFFLSVYNLGKQPVDDTSLIGQNLANQDRLNKRNRQIDKNADSMNGGMVVSLGRAGLTLAQSKGVTDALRRGGTVAIPDGSVTDAIQRMSAPDLPPTIYTQVIDTRARIQDIFGTRGSSAAGLNTERTVGGKVLNQQKDSDRIGGGFSEYLEQWADAIYNYAVQLMYVYDEKYANGQPKPKVNVSVKEGSLLPKDSVTLAMQAMELGKNGKMALVDMYKALDYPNPDELAANVWLEANAPDVLYSSDPRVAQVVQMKQEQAQAAAQAASQGEEKAPSQSINFKDLPPVGQAQMAGKVGIQLDPEGLAAHAEVVAERGKSKPAEGAPKGEN